MEVVHGAEFVDSFIWTLETEFRRGSGSEVSLFGDEGGTSSRLTLRSRRSRYTYC